MGNIKPWEKAALSQSSVFHSGFDFQAAENVLSVGDWKDAPAILIFTRIAEYSLCFKQNQKTVRSDISLESIRQYSHSKLLDEAQSPSKDFLEKKSQNRRCKNIRILSTVWGKRVFKYP